jgi:hypothetical protein
MSSITPTATPATTRQLPEWVPVIGSTVHLRYEGSRRRPVPHIIMAYKEVEPGDWVFKAVDPYGWTLTDGINTLR